MIKKSALLLGLFSVLLTAGLILTGCSDDSGGTIQRTGSEPSPSPEPDDATPTVTDVTITPSGPGVQVNKGGTRGFIAVVAGTNNPVQTVDWSIVESGTAAETGITNGLLTVAADETLSTLTVRASSTADPSKSATVTVTVVSDAPPDPEVESVTITPSGPNVPVNKGGTQIFTAVVAGTNNPVQTVTWSIEEEDKAGGTGITPDGLFTVAIDEQLTALTVKASSAADTTKSATVTVRVMGVSVPGNPISITTPDINESDLRFNPVQGPYADDFIINAPEGYDAYTWFIDGDQRPIFGTVNGNECAVHSAALTNGIHWISLIVRKGSAYYSAQKSFTINHP